MVWINQWRNKKTATFSPNIFSGSVRHVDVDQHHHQQELGWSESISSLGVDSKQDVRNIRLEPVPVPVRPVHLLPVLVRRVRLLLAPLPLLHQTQLPGNNDIIIQQKIFLKSKLSIKIVDVCIMLTMKFILFMLYNPTVIKTLQLYL